MTESPIAWTDDVEAAAWVGERVDHRKNAVTIMVPAGYSAYARIATGRDPDKDEVGYLIDFLRRESPKHGCDPDQCWFALATLYGWTGQQPFPSRGLQLTAEEEALKDTDFDAFFNKLITDMAAGRRPQSPGAQQPRYPHRTLDIDTRSYMLYRGPVEAATAPAEAGGPLTVPDLWWPYDRTWFVGADTDWVDIYLGGPNQLVGALLDEPTLRTVPIDPDDSLDPDPLS